MADMKYPRMGAPQPDRTCAYCRTQIPARAAKCAACGEWTGPTDYSPVAKGLRVVAIVWLVLSVLGGLIWSLGSLGMETGAEYSFAIGLALLLQGLLVGFSALALAEIVPPRRDR